MRIDKNNLQMMSEKDHGKDINVLMEFLNFPLESGSGILDKFRGEFPHNYEYNHCHDVIKGGGELAEFLFIEGWRPNNKVLLVAHVDTYWDKNWKDHPKHISSQQPGLGADGRAGCALLWLLRESGHSLLLTNGSVHGQLGARCLLFNYSILIGQQQFMIQLNLPGNEKYKCYPKVCHPDFIKYVSDKTGFVHLDGRSSQTDLVKLCRQGRGCGVNLSVGYHNERQIGEHIEVDQWLHTLNILRKWLADSSINRYEAPYTSGWGAIP